ncbi:MAG: sel1 repeat family protein, partial [Kiritimatiellae bacterium]|nr:sel1 repeat family protein [Kiritimatiellia bacterium]
VVMAAVAGIAAADGMADKLKACRAEAEKGNAKAQFYLGMCYSNGEGVEKDGAEAVKWYRKAAEMGERTAQNNLASCLMSGQGVEKDPVEAGKWFRKSAEQGYVEAQVNLGVYCDRGEGGVKDHAEAVKWFRRAAAQGHPAARKWLAELGVAWELDPLAPLGLNPGMSAEKLQAQLEKLDEKGDYQLAQCEADKVSRKVYSVVVATREGFGYAEAFARSDVLAKLFMARHKSKPEFVANKATWRETVDGHAYKYELGVKEADDVKGKWFVVYGIFDLTLGKEVQARLLGGDAEKLAITFRKSDGTKVTVPVKQAQEAKDKPYPVK